MGVKKMTHFELVELVQRTLERNIRTELPDDGSLRILEHGDQGEMRLIHVVRFVPGELDAFEWNVDHHHAFRFTACGFEVKAR